MTKSWYTTCTLYPPTFQRTAVGAGKMPTSRHHAHTAYSKHGHQLLFSGRPKDRKLPLETREGSTRHPFVSDNGVVDKPTIPATSKHFFFYPPPLLSTSTPTSIPPMSTLDHSPPLKNHPKRHCTAKHRQPLSMYRNSPHTNQDSLGVSTSRLTVHNNHQQTRTNTTTKLEHISYHIGANSGSKDEPQR